MRYFANPCTEQVRDALASGLLGCITTPRQGNVTFPDEWDVIADNGCFSGQWSHDEWFRWLLDLPRTVRFAVAPDVFHPDGSPAHADTLERWKTYGPLMERHGFTPAFVCQVGATPSTVPQEARVLFLGGTTDWKLSSEAKAIALDASNRGVWVHMGRVNSHKRYQYAASIGCDSADGTYLRWGPDVNLPRLSSWVRRVRANPPMVEPSLWDLVTT